jgi:hypothetical protein
MRMAWVALGEPQASDGGDLQAAELHACVAAVAGLVHDGNVAPRQGGQLAVNDVGKPCAGELHARFDRGPLADHARVS